jgi:hypothetical protein
MATIQELRTHKALSPRDLAERAHFARDSGEY